MKKALDIHNSKLTKSLKMTSNNIVKFLVDKEQLTKLKSNASNQGFKTLSSYLRDISLNEDIPSNKILIKLYSLECSIKQMQEVIQNGRAKS